MGLTLEELEARKDEIKAYKIDQAAKNVLLKDIDKQISEERTRLANLTFSWSDIGSAALSIAKTLGPLALSALADPAPEVADPDSDCPCPCPPQHIAKVGSVSIHKKAGKIIAVNDAADKGYASSFMLRMSQPDKPSDKVKGSNLAGTQETFYAAIPSGKNNSFNLNSIITPFLQNGDLITQPYVDDTSLHPKLAAPFFGNIAWSTLGKTIALLSASTFTLTGSLYFQRSSDGFSIVTTVDSSATVGSATLRVMAQGIFDTIQGTNPVSTEIRTVGGSNYKPLLDFIVKSDLQTETNIGLHLEFKVPLDDVLPHHSQAKKKGLKAVPFESH